ncbi:MAG: beta-ketoacyl-[acyl-carrier-protein] synthase family protein [Candidatus Omnitrophota bacterium]|nr:beta-ketoacyl-[acyl-carrier-protein] synthase family protein [Candidatus Omnitrophota bacterium]
MNTRIVATGLGVISSLGIGKDTFWNAVCKGMSGISPVTSFDTSAFPTHRGGEVKDFNPLEFVGQRKASAFGRSSLFAVSAACLAARDANIDFSGAHDRAGVCLGTTMGETRLFERLNEAWSKKGHQSIEPGLLPQIPPYSMAAHVASEFGLRGPNYLIPTACAAGNYAIGYACDLIKDGTVDLMLAGGVDAFSRIAFCGFNRLLAVAPEVCQPFDKNRKGMMVGEGAGIVLLETLEHARSRGATIYAEVLGYGVSCDAFHMTAPAHQGIKEALCATLRASSLKIGDVDYLNAHGTGTPANDKEECRAIKEVFGDTYKKLAVSSIKSMLGHTMGAASALEAIACCLTLKYGIIPPTINFSTPDPDCDIDCVPNIARCRDVRVALNNAFAFGGNNSCLALAKFPS